MSGQQPPGQEPPAEWLRLRDLVRWLPYSRKEILILIDAGVIRGTSKRPGGRKWYFRSQIKRSLGV